MAITLQKRSLTYTTMPNNEPFLIDHLERLIENTFYGFKKEKHQNRI
jgi:hypothetical protein